MLKSAPTAYENLIIVYNNNKRINAENTVATINMAVIINGIWSEDVSLKRCVIGINKGFSNRASGLTSAPKNGTTTPKLTTSKRDDKIINNSNSQN